ncbi:MAG TPA: folylpolyglutamate synthase/dihydrofolate synthase family protein [Pyrinomonadaceae bacterium]|nr:folylpolyglutamate synthase/dihydrofolate synthase family protein [Pyrinomonadaceae bacterium]
MFDDALQYLLSLGHETLAIKLGLTNTERLLEALGNPQESFPSIQIAGTNGKGSTAVMLDSICRSAGIRTGLYTSPHLVSITERIRINSQEISREDFARLTSQVRRAAQQLLDAGKLETLPTFFEHLTAIALLAFREAGVQLAILETGLGGRLDATTTARAETVAITPIALDHQEYLGSTLAEIATEKAAIIRPEVTAIIAPQDAEALEVILKRCADSGVTPRVNEAESKLLSADETGRVCATFETKSARYENVCLGLRGRHQVTNASTAISLAEALCERGFSISHSAVIEGIEKSRHAGRLDLREGHPSILFDGAHNAAGARALRDYLDEFIKAPITIIFGAMRDKDLKEIAGILFPAAHQLILTQPKNPRSATLETLAPLVPFDFDKSRLTLAPSSAEALSAAHKLTSPEGLICVTGSLYLIGEAMQNMSVPPAASGETKG